MFDLFNIFKRNKDSLKSMHPDLLNEFTSNVGDDWSKRQGYGDDEKSGFVRHFRTSLLDYMHSPDDSEPHAHYKSFIDSIAPQDNSQPSFLNNSGSTTGVAASLQQGHVEKNSYEFHPAFKQAVENVYNRAMSNDPQKYFGSAPQNQNTAWSNGIQAGNNALQFGNAGGEDWLGHVRNNLDDKSNLYKHMAQDSTVPNYVKNHMTNDLARKIDETDQLAQNFGKFGKALKYSPAVDLAVNVHDNGVGEGAAATGANMFGAESAGAIANALGFSNLSATALKFLVGSLFSVGAKKGWEGLENLSKKYDFPSPMTQMGGGSLFPAIYPEKNVPKKNKKY